MDVTSSAVEKRAEWVQKGRRQILRRVEYVEMLAASTEPQWSKQVSGATVCHLLEFRPFGQRPLSPNRSLPLCLSGVDLAEIAINAIADLWCRPEPRMARTIVIHLTTRFSWCSRTKSSLSLSHTSADIASGRVPGRQPLECRLGDGLSASSCWMFSRTTACLLRGRYCPKHDHSADDSHMSWCSFLSRRLMRQRFSSKIRLVPGRRLQRSFQPQEGPSAPNSLRLGVAKCV
jgi:hypothetical protein